jgi:hypothetical protein
VRRPLGELAPSTVAAYRHKARKLWLKIQSGQATPSDRLELAELEALLGVRGSEIPPPGRPRKWAARCGCGTSNEVSGSQAALPAT